MISAEVIKDSLPGPVLDIDIAIAPEEENAAWILVSKFI